MAKREKDMQVNLEPAIHKAVIDLTRQIGDSQSNYIRRLIINDLRDRGLLPESLLAELLVA